MRHENRLPALCSGICKREDLKEILKKRLRYWQEESPACEERKKWRLAPQRRAFPARTEEFSFCPLSLKLKAEVRGKLFLRQKHCRDSKQIP